MKISPQFGGKVTDEQKAEYEKTGRYINGKFQNTGDFSLGMNLKNMIAVMKKVFTLTPNSSPSRNLEVLKLPVGEIGTQPNTLLTWLGHSSFLLEVDNQIILLDPMFSKWAAPLPYLGKPRYNSQMSFELSDLPRVDAVVISHDHYDHLDYPSIKALAAKTKKFFVPLGVGNHLRSWGINDTRIVELDWFQSKNIGDVEFSLLPAKHFSGRRIGDQMNTLWGSWAIKGSSTNIFFSGDSGYGDHFKEIGEKYGPFDLGLLECGQYDVLWPDVHMMPEETIQAGIDIKAKRVLPIHWASFTLANHTWTDPAERATAAGAKLGIEVVTPQIGERFDLSASDFPNQRWWEDY